MANVPSPVDEWVPLVGHQFLDASASTALTIPPITGQGGIAKNAHYVAVLTCQGVPAYVRQDGQAVTAAVTGGKLLQVGDALTVYGLPAMKAIRLIRSSAGGSVAVEYYYYVPAVQ